MKKHSIYIVFLISFLIAIPTSAQHKNYIRGDMDIKFKWRLGYSEFPVNLNSPVEKEDSERGVYEWFDGYFWTSNYKNWNDSIISGVNLLYRGGSPYARSVQCTSELVPSEKAGLPVTFAIPLQYTIGSESRVSMALSITGREREDIVMNLSPKKEIVVTNGQSKISFHTLNFKESPSPNPLTQVCGILHIRVYPNLLNYGGRMTFEFNSLTQHMDIGSGVVIGSLWNDISQTDIEKAWASSGLTDGALDKADTKHQQKLSNWVNASKKIYEDLNKRGQVKILCSDTPKHWDRGELRVQAYSGNPVKDFQFGATTGKMGRIAQSVVKQTGKQFSLFRYQHHRLPWKTSNPNEIDPTEAIYLDEWLKAAQNSSEKVMLCLQLSPIMKDYRTATQTGLKSLPKEGLQNFPWTDITKGYLTTLKYAKTICPKLKIVQMPYEFDNMSNNEWHRDAHYMFFKSLYKAVNEVNKSMKKDDQIEIAGLSVNNPMDKWDFIDGFLKRYKEDSEPEKQLDYLAWHAYLFPRDKPNHPQGFNRKLQELLQKHNLPRELPVVIDESGLAEPSTIEDLSDLKGASHKEAAMACFTASIHDWYLKENGNFIPITGAGWHFGLLTYGKQDALSPYAKGMVLRNRLGSQSISSSASPCNQDGYGMYSFATKDTNSIKVLVWSASPSIFYEHIPRINYNNTEIIFENLPEKFRKKSLKVTIESFSPGDEAALSILSQDKCQTLPLIRGADRYTIDFTEDEIKDINAIKAKTFIATPDGNNLKLELDVVEHSMYLIKLEI